MLGSTPTSMTLKISSKCHRESNDLLIHFHERGIGFGVARENAIFKFGVGSNILEMKKVDLANRNDLVG